MYTLKIYHDVKIEKDEQNEPVLVQNMAESSLGFYTGHSYIALNDGGDKPIVRGFYPDNVYKDDSERIKLSKEFQEKNPDFNAYHAKEIKLNKEQYDKALNELNKYEKYIDPIKKQGTLPKEIINGMWRLLGNNCSDFTNTIYRSTGLQGSFTYQYTTPELKQIPGVIEYYIDKFGVGDQDHIVSGGSIEDIALQYNVDKSLISETKAKNIPLDMDAQSMMGLGPKFYKIAPNMELMESMKQQIEFKQTEESKEMFKDQFSKLSISPIDYSKFNKIELVSKEELSPRAKSLIIEKIGNFKVKFQQILDKFKSKIINAGKLVDENETAFEKQILESNAKNKVAQFV
ncbi:hypothetical protein OAP56_04590 [Rickettsiaceae bacterium]|nr:hypothetical protein [Rickettsiaceae bacterium]